MDRQRRPTSPSVVVVEVVLIREVVAVREDF
jgi:hypothetical protein